MKNLIHSIDVLNDTDNLPIQDIMVDDRNNMMSVYLTDGTRFLVHVENAVFVRYNIEEFYLIGGLLWH